MMIAILIAAIVVALVVFSFLCYKKAPPTQAIVVTGFGLSRAQGASAAAACLCCPLYSVPTG